MPSLERFPIATGVTRTDYHWGYILCGSKEALIASGFVKAEWFPDGVQRVKRGGIKRSAKLFDNGMRINLRPGVAGEFDVWFSDLRREARLRGIMRGFWGNDRETQELQIAEAMEALHKPAVDDPAFQRFMSRVTLH